MTYTGHSNEDPSESKARQRQAEEEERRQREYEERRAREVQEKGEEATEA